MCVYDILCIMVAYFVHIIYVFDYTYAYVCMYLYDYRINCVSYVWYHKEQFVWPPMAVLKNNTPNSPLVVGVVLSITWVLNDLKELKLSNKPLDLEIPLHFLRLGSLHHVIFNSMWYLFLATIYLRFGSKLRVGSMYLCFKLGTQYWFLHGVNIQRAGCYSPTWPISFRIPKSYSHFKCGCTYLQRFVSLNDVRWVGISMNPSI